MKNEIKNIIYPKSTIEEDDELNKLEKDLNKKIEDLKSRKKYNFQTKLNNIEKSKKDNLKRLL